MSWTIKKYILLVVIVLGFFLALWGVNYPFVGLYNASNIDLSNTVQNYLRFGFLRLKFLPTYYMGPHFPQTPTYYLHHPILMFLLAVVPVILFGFGNWQIHCIQFLFTAGSLFFIYKIAYNLWNQKIALWSLALAAVYPMTEFFWKMMFFEQISMFFCLWIIYVFLLYLKHPQKKYMFFLFILSLFASFSDWGGAYLVLPFIFLFFTPLRKKMRKFFLVYVLGITLGLGFFVSVTYLVKGGYRDLSLAILNRSVRDQLFGLPFWWLRLALVTVIRMVLYFTPLSVAMLVYFFWYVKKDYKYQTLPLLMLVYFFIYGMLNIIVLPAGTWGHGYFLYYFVPFFAYTGALLFEKLSNKFVVFFTLIGIICISSILVTFWKNYQIEKQIWKYELAQAVAQKFKNSNQIIGTNNFPGELLWVYFHIQTQNIPFVDITYWITQKKYHNITYLLLPCTDSCSQGEWQMILLAKKFGSATAYRTGSHTSYLLKKGNASLTPKDEMFVTKIIRTSMSRPPTKPSSEDSSYVIRVYRSIRDTLSAVQI